MMQSRRPKLLDLVAVLQCPPDADVEVGDVGTVVKLLPPDGIEVEFLDRDGRTRCLATLSVEDVLTLNRERTPVGD
jgi:catabolite regulation protein CreA